MNDEDEEMNMKTTEYFVVPDKVPLHSEENPQRISSSRIGRYRGVCTVILFLALLAISVIFSVLYFKLQHDYDNLRSKVDLNAKNEGQKRINYVSAQELMDRKLNNSEESVRRYVSLLMKNSIDSRLRWLKEAVNSLIPALENLKINLTSLTNSSDSKMRRFGRVVGKLKDRLVLAQNDLAHLNVSLHTELSKASDSASSSIGKVRKELSTFSNSTASKISRLITDVNDTNINIVNIMELLSSQNSSQHSHVLDTFTALAWKVEDADKKLVNLRNFTATQHRQFRNDLNNTQESLERARNEFVHFNRSIYLLIQGVAKSQSTSVKNISERISSVRKDFESNKKLGATERKTTDVKLSKTKAEFRESLKEEKETTSALEKKIAQNQDGQHSQQIQIDELRKELNKLKNKASGYLRVNMPLILTSALVLFSIFTLN